MDDVFFPLAVVVSIGAFLRYGRPEIEQTRRSVNQLVLYVFLPALVFRTVIEADIDRVFFEIPIMAFIGVMTSLVMSFLVFRYLPIPGPTKGAMILGATFGNVTYLGLPILLETFPKATEQAAEVSVLFEVTKSSLNLTLGAMTAIYFGSHEEVTLRKTVFEAMKLPPIWALIFAILLKSSQISCPAFVLETTKLLSSSVSGLMMLSLGMALRFRINRLIWLVIPVSLLKLVVAPLLMARIVTLYGVNDVYGSATIIEAGMPSQLLSFVISSRFKLDEETLSTVILADTMLAFLTVPWVIEHLALGH